MLFKHFGHKCPATEELIQIICTHTNIQQAHASTSIILKTVLFLKVFTLNHIVPKYIQK